jgi:hypothetical protein
VTLVDVLDVMNIKAASYRIAMRHLLLFLLESLATWKRSRNPLRHGIHELLHMPT